MSPHQGATEAVYVTSLSFSRLVTSLQEPRRALGASPSSVVTATIGACVIVLAVQVPYNRYIVLYEASCSCCGVLSVRYSNFRGNGELGCFCKLQYLMIKLNTNICICICQHVLTL